MGSWIEAAAPLPLIGVVRVAGTFGERAHVYVAIVDVPAFLAFRIAAAGEFGHQALNRALAYQANYPPVGGWWLGMHPLSYV